MPEIDKSFLRLLEGCPNIKEKDSTEMFGGLTTSHHHQTYFSIVDSLVHTYPLKTREFMEMTTREHKNPHQIHQGSNFRF